MVLKFSYYLNICLPHKVGLVLLLFFVFFTFSNIIYGKNISPLKYDDAEIITSTEINISNLSNEHLLQDGVLSTKAIVNSAMPKLKESRLGKILLNYYEKSFGGTEGWNKINSYKVVAELNSTNGIFTHKSIFKKPNLYKLVVKSETIENVVAFNGSYKWQKISQGEGDVSPEIAINMDRMIHEPDIFTFLLYPLKEGKFFQYEGTVRESNAVCYEIRAYSKQGYIMSYYLDVESYLLVAVKIVDQLNHFSPVVVKYSDYRLVNGIYFPFNIRYFVGGEWDSVLNVNQITVNVGVLSWMFDKKDSMF